MSLLCQAGIKGPSIFVWVWDLYSGPHVRDVSMLAAEPHPQPLVLIILILHCTFYSIWHIAIMDFMEYTVTFKYMYPVCRDQIGVIAVFLLRRSSFLRAGGAMTKKEGIDLKQKQRPRILSEANSSKISWRGEQRKGESVWGCTSATWIKDSLVTHGLSLTVTITGHKHRDGQHLDALNPSCPLCVTVSLVAHVQGLPLALRNCFLPAFIHSFGK